MTQQNINTNAFPQPFGSERIDGAFLFPDYVSRGFHDKIVSLLDADGREHWTEVNPGVHRKHFTNQPGIPGEAIPPWADELVDGFLERKLIHERPNSVTVLEYKAGAGRDMHYDEHFRDAILGITLVEGSDMIIVEDRTGKEMTLTLPPRSLYMLKDRAFHNARHGLPHENKPQKRRIALIFRYLRDEHITK